MGKSSGLRLLPPDDPIFSGGATVFSPQRFKQSTTTSPSDTDEPKAQSVDHDQPAPLRKVSLRDLPRSEIKPMTPEERAKLDAEIEEFNRTHNRSIMDDLM